MGAEDAVRGNVWLEKPGVTKSLEAKEREDLEATAVFAEQIGEAPHGVGRARVIRRVDVLAHGMAVAVDHLNVGVTGDERRIGVQDGDTASQIVRSVRVVVRRPFEVFADGQLRRDIEISGGADVPILTVVPDARVAVGIAGADGGRRVGRGVVGEDQLEVPKRLVEERIDGLGEVALAIEHGQPDANFGQRG